MGSTPTSGTMNKEELIQKLLIETQNEYGEVLARIDKYQDDINTSPDYRSTWSDTTKFQLRQIKKNLDTQRLKIKKAIKSLDNIDIESASHSVKIGTLITTDQQQLFLAPPGTPGVDIEMITVLAADSPLGKNLINKKVGESFNLGDETLIIQKIL